MNNNYHANDHIGIGSSKMSISIPVAALAAGAVLPVVSMVSRNFIFVCIVGTNVHSDSINGLR